MNLKFISLIILNSIIRYTAAQQNWAAVPCFDNKWAINSMVIDSLHNEIILNSIYGSENCNVTYKGVFGYNGSEFHDLDFGLDKHNPNSSTNGDLILGCIPHNGKTLFGGAFASVGSNTLMAEGIALWNGTVWDTFPKRCFPSNPLRNSPGNGINGFLRYQNKLWIYGAFDTIGGVIAKNICSFDGNTFTSHNIPVPDTYNYYARKMIAYKNKLIAIGQFYNTSFTISRAAIYDGSTWTSLGSGIVGSLSFIYDMTIYKDTLYIAGSWPKSAGNVSNHIMKWDGNQLSDAGFGNYYSTDAITSLVVYKDRLFAFGNFNHAANQKSWGVAYYENGSWTVPKDSIANYGVRSSVVYKNELYIAGAFKNINEDTTIKFLAKLRCDNFDYVCTTGLEKNTLEDFGINIFPNPLNNKLNIDFEKINFQKSNLKITNTLGQTVYIIDKLNQNQEIDLSFLSSGIYYINVQNSTSQIVFKIFKE